MTLHYADFTGAAAPGLPGFTVATTSTSGAGFALSGSGTAVTDVSSGTSTAIAVSGTAPSGNDQFAQITLVNNAGTSSGVMVRATKVDPANAASVTTTGYLARHNGTAIALFKLDNAGASAAVGSAYTHTRATGDKLRLVGEGTTLRVYINDMTTPVITATDTTYTTGRTALRAAGQNISFDDFYGGDLADISQVGSSSPTTPTTPTTPSGTDVQNAAPADSRPTWRSIMYAPSGRLLTAGKPLQRLRADFFGPAGTYTPPAWLTVPEGTAELLDPTTSPSRLQIKTAATTGAKATLAVAPGVLLSQYAAIRVDVEAMSFSSDSPPAIWRLGATGASGVGGGAIQRPADDVVHLHTGGEANRTIGTISHLQPSGTQRRQTSVLICPQAKEVFLLEDDMVLFWRSGVSDWVDGVGTIALSIEATSATVVALRLATLTVTLFA